MTQPSDARPLVAAYDGSSQAEDAVALAAALAAATGDRVLLAGAYGPEGVLSETELDSRRAQVFEALGAAAGSLPADLAVERRAVPGSSAAAALQTLAEAEHPRTLVLGSCHRGALGRVLIGSVAERLLHGSPCPVTVAPRGLASGDAVQLRNVAVGFDGKAESWTALQRAAQIASAAGARLRVLMTVPPLATIPGMPIYPSELVERHFAAAEAELDHAVRSVTRKLQTEPVLLRGVPAQRLAEAARGVDLLVVGSRGYGPLQRVLLGSVSATLMHSAPCAVMVVPRTTEFDPSETGMAAADEVAVSG